MNGMIVQAVYLSLLVASWFDWSKSKLSSAYITGILVSVAFAVEQTGHLLKLY